MKIHFKPLVLGVLLLSSSVSFSGYSAVMTADNGGSQVSEDLAKRVAVNFMTTRNKSVQVSDVVTEEKDGLVTMYVCNFEDGGWVMVSADFRADPILAYSLDSKYEKENSEENVAYSQWLDAYKEGISYLDWLSSKDNTDDGSFDDSVDTLLTDVSDKWSGLMGGTTLRGLSYEEGTDLLCDWDREGHVRWGQSFNDYCPVSEYANDNCEHSIAGCGAVALAQVMWKWSWPTFSHVVDKYGNSYDDSYDWRLMTAYGLNDDQHDEISRFISRCGLAQYAKYGCSGTTTYARNATYAFRDFGYNSLETQFRSNWRNDNWHHLLTTEIRAGRPIYIGGQNPKNTDEGHAFVLSGYQYREADNQFYYYVNFGWNGSYNGYYNIDMTNMLLSSGGVISNTSNIYNTYQCVVIGVSPYTRNFCETATQVSANQTYQKYSASSLIVPCDNEFVVENGAKVILTAKKEVNLRSGFFAEAGSDVSVEITDDEIQEPSEYEIEASLISSQSQKLSVDVKNANSWILKIRYLDTKYNSSIIREPYNVYYEQYSDAGYIEEDGVVELMTGTEIDYTGYKYEVFLFNNNGIIKKISGVLGANSYQISDYHGENVVGGSSSVNVELGGGSQSQSTGVEDDVEVRYLSSVYPNPASDQVTIVVGDTPSNVVISDMRGDVIYNQTISGETVVNLSAQSRGVYCVKIVSDSDTKVEKLLLK